MNVSYRELTVGEDDIAINLNLRLTIMPLH